MKSRYEEVKTELLTQCAGQNGEDCGGDPSVGISACSLFDAGRGCLLKTPEYTGMGLNDLAEAVHKNAVDHGWWNEERGLPEILMLCVSELSEALEEFRSGKPAFYFNCKLDGVSDGDECADDNGDCYFRTGGEVCEKAKPEGIAVELADCIIRILDYCGKAGIDIERAIAMKHEYNKKRPYRHGGKIC